MPEFVVHEHEAKRAGLHHDFRLEADGVLESWAIPKGIPETAGVRRLAIKVADHAVGYAGFEGRIEEGYGRGDVRIFDSGEYDLISGDGDHRFVNLRGDKIRGNYYLRRTEGNRWLMWKRWVF